MQRRPGRGVGIKLSLNPADVNKELTPQALAHGMVSWIIMYDVWLFMFGRVQDQILKMLPYAIIMILTLFQGHRCIANTPCFLCYLVYWFFGGFCYSE